MPASRHLGFVLVAAGAAATLAAATAVPAAAHDRPVVTRGVFAAAASGGPALTYDPIQVPVGARAVVRTALRDDDRTVVTLRVKGLLPGETYGAHAHYRPCGATGALAGAHYQQVPDPAAGGSETVASVDPAYANDDNEIWLDLVTDSEGDGRARTTVDWRFRPTVGGVPRSVVLHLETTSTGGAVPPGNAGARLACVNVAF